MNPLPAWSFLSPDYWVGLTRDPVFWWQLGVLLLAWLGGWWIARIMLLFILKNTDKNHPIKRIALSVTRRVIFPVSMLLLLMIGLVLFELQQISTPLLSKVMPLVIAFVMIRLLVFALHETLGRSAAIKAWEKAISLSIWLLAALVLLDWLNPVLAILDSVALNLGEMRLSLLDGLKLVFTIALLLSLAFWASAIMEKRIESSGHVAPALKAALAKFMRFFLITLAFLVALNAVGIDLTTLTVFGGALGVGLGFGLQRIASNFISGFILVLDRSIKPGDVISIEGKMGWVEALRGRYIVVRNRDGVETLIPNETLVTSEVINWSYSDPNVRVKIPVSISYDNDPEQAMALMQEIAENHPRVLAEPAPSVRLIEFGDNGIHLEMRVWISDPELGIGSVKSEINLLIWRAFKAASINIPFPQRDIRIHSMPRLE